MVICIIIMIFIVPATSMSETGREMSLEQNKLLRYANLGMWYKMYSRINLHVD